MKCVVKLKNCWIRIFYLCGARFGPHDYDSGDKKTKKAKIQKDKKTKRQKNKKAK